MQQIHSNSKQLKSWQWRAFFSMAVLYLFYYFGKKNLSAATGTILETFDFSRQQFGMVMTAFTLTYALGQFINGFLGDRYNPKWVMIVGALGGVLANLCFGFSSTLLWFILFWAVNGYFSSMGWRRAVVSCVIGFLSDAGVGGWDSTISSPISVGP